MNGTSLISRLVGRLLPFFPKMDPVPASQYPACLEQRSTSDARQGIAGSVPKAAPVLARVGRAVARMQAQEAREGREEETVFALKTPRAKVSRLRSSRRQVSFPP